MKKYIQTTILIFISMLFFGCSSLDVEADYPLDPDAKKAQKRGRLTGDGIVLFGRKSNDDEPKAGGNSGIGINSYLWRAALDTLSFMPLSSADPFGGVILTNWYESPDARGERFKLNVLLLSRNLTATSVKISVFKQVRDQRSGWKDAAINADMARQLENKILTRARELRIEKEAN